MTLWGQSAGGASVDSYGYAYPKDPIIKGLIIDSGSAYLLGSTDAPQTNFTSLAGMVGCKDLAPEAEIGCMRNVSANAIENALSSYVSSGATPKLAFTPFPDNVTAFSNPADRAERGLVAKLVGISLLLFFDCGIDKIELINISYTASNYRIQYKRRSWFCILL